jgi:uncharacterized protein (TIGR00266 family)
MLRVDLAAGETLIAEAGSMVARSEHVQMEARLSAGGPGGFMATLKSLVIALVRKVIGGESFIVNHFSSPQGGTVWVAPSMTGTVAYRRLNGERIILSSGAYVASVGNVDVKMKFGGLSTMFAKEGAFMLDVGGTGDLWFNSYGGIEEIQLHLVGYEGNLNMTVTRAGSGLMSMVASGEGLICKFEGTGTIWIQSRNMDSLVGFVTRLLTK